DDPGPGRDPVRHSHDADSFGIGSADSASERSPPNLIRVATRSMLRPAASIRHPPSLGSCRQGAGRHAFLRAPSGRRAGSSTLRLSSGLPRRARPLTAGGGRGLMGGWSGAPAPAGSPREGTFPPVSLQAVGFSCRRLNSVATAKCAELRLPKKRTTKGPCNAIITFPPISLHTRRFPCTRVNSLAGGPISLH